MDNVVTILVVVLPFACTGLGWCVRTIVDNRNKEKDNYDVVQQALKILLRGELCDLHKHYTEQGYITKRGLEEFESTLEVYDKLVGVNGFVDDLASDIRELKVR